ncbi:MAG: hypothetical protein CM1200mP18_08870 [Gammaproteobacteria bacterium]|nr:MAG: hypothetical protein CM1200mP18_08870 [Gammaproteobacteria bacterium]
MKNDKFQVSEKQYQDLKKTIFQPLENYQVVEMNCRGNRSPSYPLPLSGFSD